MKTAEEVIALLSTTKNEDEWNKACDQIKAEFHGYPGFWWEKIMMSGLATKIQNSWMSTAVRGNLVALNDPLDDQLGYVTSIKMLPPSQEEIDEWNSRKKRNSTLDRLRNE